MGCGLLQLRCRLGRCCWNLRVSHYASGTRLRDFEVKVVRLLRLKDLNAFNCQVFGGRRRTLPVRDVYQNPLRFL
jgi:hypothetical protein